MIVNKVRSFISPGTVIPKPENKGQFVVKGWGERRGEPALIYSIPNHSNSAKPYHKGITVSEFEKAYEVLERSGEFTRAWFNDHLPACAKEGGCNFTTIGGIFQLLGVARYSERGVYVRKR
jgi:hypothetical protein